MDYDSSKDSSKAGSNVDSSVFPREADQTFLFSARHTVFGRAANESLFSSAFNFSSLIFFFLFFQFCFGKEGEVGEDRQEKERGLSKEGEDDSSMVAGKKADEKAWEKNCGHGKYGSSCSG